MRRKSPARTRDRPQLARLIDQLRRDDVVTVTRLDRLARSTRDLLDIAERLQEAGTGLRSLAEPWADTTSPAGRMVLTVFAGIAEFERALISERTGTGRIAAKARGVRFGRPPKLTADQIALAQRLIGEGRSLRDAAKILNVHVSTLYRASLFRSAQHQPPTLCLCRFSVPLLLRPFYQRYRENYAEQIATHERELATAPT